MIARGPRPTIEETALSDLEFLLSIALKHEPGSYRASDTIHRLRIVVAEQRRGAMAILAEVGVVEGDYFYWEALRMAKFGSTAAEVGESMMADKAARWKSVLTVSEMA